MSAWTSVSPQFALSLALLLAAGLLGLSILMVARRRRLPAPDRSRALESGFDLLLDARWQEAAAILEAAIKSDPNRALEYLELGKLFRRQGQLGRAARMFEQLRVRPALDRTMRLVIEYELALSYQALGWYKPAIALLDQVLEADSSHAEARQTLRRIYEDMECWEKAAAVEMLRLRWGESHDHRTLAALLTQQGKVAWAAADLHASSAHLRRALALDPDCTEAMLYLGRLFLQQGQWSQAFELWDELARSRPEWFFLAFRDLQAAFRHLEDDAGWESLLRTFVARHPGDPTGHLALAEWYASRGQAEAATHCLRQVLALDPGCREAHLALVSLAREQGVSREILDSYMQLAQQTSRPSGGQFRCRTCGHARGELFWRCPACHRWTTPERLLPQPGVTPATAGELVSSRSQPGPGAPASVVVAHEAPVHSAPEH